MRAGLRSMRARMTVLFAVFVGLLMLAGGAAVRHREARRAENNVREILSVAVQRARSEIAESDSEDANGRESLLEIIQSNSDEIEAGGLVLLVADSSGVLWRSRQHAPEWPAVSDDWRIQSLGRGDQTLIVALDWEPIEEDLEETVRALWVLGFVITAATALGAWVVVGKTLSPLNKLAAQALNASTDSLQVRLQSPSSDAEMRHLTETLNDLLQRLEKEAQARGRFYAAASHELRTPIQSLLGQIDVARTRRRTVESHEKILADLQYETVRLENLVRDLLQLNALEMRQNQAPQEKLNLAFWIEHAITQQEAEIARQELTVATDVPDLEIVASSAHLEILLRNLLENAVKYATPQSRLSVRVYSREKQAVLEIWNACSLSHDADVTAWFEPFFRPDVSRNSQTGGNGLGLSIVAALARANRWTVQLQVRNQGVETQVLFPKAD